MAEAIVKQVLSGKSGQVIAPGFGVTLAFLRGMPHWYQIGLRSDGAKIMTEWKGRQVIDVEKWKTDGERANESRSANERRANTMFAYVYMLLRANTL